MADDPKRDELNLRRQVVASQVAVVALEAMAELEPLAMVALVVWSDGSVSVNASQQKDHPAALLGALRAAKLWGPEWATRTAHESGIPPEALLTSATPTGNDGPN